FQRTSMNFSTPYDDWVGHDATAHQAPTRFQTLMMWLTVLLPFIGLAIGFAWLFHQPAGLVDFFTCILMYAIAGFGITVGYHRMATHRAFTGHPIVRAFWMIAGSTGFQGPIISWVAVHRRHHQRSDMEGDPHSPHANEHGSTLAGLWHAHTAWLIRPEPANLRRSVKDLAADPLTRFVDRTYLLWVILGALIPFAIGWLAKGTIGGAFATLVWGFFVRLAVMQHATWSVNSICHTFGYRSYRASDESRNNPLVAFFSLGEGWHNNHHAFPTSARHGIAWYEIDFSWIVIWWMRTLRIVREVRVPTESDLALRRRTSSEAGEAETAEAKPRAFRCSRRACSR
ncbi:MAG: fatty acid desaturase, partial [Tepidisphaeraceae bacterium]